jgi:hypothetical protein
MSAAYTGDTVARDQARLERANSDLCLAALLVTGLMALVFLVAFIGASRRATKAESSVEGGGF